MAKKNNEKEEKSKENKLLLILAIIFTGLVVIITAIVFLLPKLTEVPSVTIPNVSNKSIVEAGNILEEAGLNVVVETKSITSDSVEEGKVVKTSPESGRKVKEGSSITLYVSVGQGGYLLEDIVGQNYLEQKAILEKMYNLYVEIEEVEITDFDKYEPGEIIGTEPKAGTLLKEGDTITLSIPDTIVLYPDFTSGKYSLKDIQSFADMYDLTLKIEYVETNEYEPGTIYEQSMEVGTKVANKDKLVIYISSEVFEGEADNTEEAEPSEE